jgi:hypothetical protein
MPPIRSPRNVTTRQPPQRWRAGWALAAGWAGLSCAALALPPATADLPLLQTPIVQLRLALDDRNHREPGRRPWQAVDPWADPNAPQPKVSLGLEFLVVDPAQGARGLLRVQLPGSSVLQFRPRGGGLVLNYRRPF